MTRTISADRTTAATFPGTAATALPGPSDLGWD